LKSDFQSWLIGSFACFGFGLIGAAGLIAVRYNLHQCMSHLINHLPECQLIHQLQRC